MSYYNSPLDSIYSQIKEIYSILSKQQTTIWEEDPIKGFKLLLHDIKGMLNGTITSTIDFGGHPQDNSIKILFNLYTNGFDIKDECMDAAGESDKINRYAASAKEISLLDEIIQAILDNNLPEIEKKAREYADEYYEKVIKKPSAIPSLHDKKQDSENPDGNFNFRSIVQDMDKNGVKITNDSIEALSHYITSNPKLAKSDDIMRIISRIVYSILGDDKGGAFMKRVYGR